MKKRSHYLRHVAWAALVVAGLLVAAGARAAEPTPTPVEEKPKSYITTERPDLTAAVQAKQPFRWCDGNGRWSLKEGKETEDTMEFRLGEPIRLRMVFQKDARGDQKTIMDGDAFTFERVMEASYTTGPLAGQFAYSLVAASAKRSNGEAIPVKNILLAGLPHRIESVSVLLCMLQAWFETEGPPATLATQSASSSGEEAWTNSLGMRFVSVPGTKVLMSRYETRVADYRAFVEAVNDDETAKLIAPDFEQTGEHPVVNVSWHDARRFCAWLTARENRAHRLPTDAEWSVAVGLGEGEGGTPEDKDGKAAGYPWGSQWPPPRGAANLAPSLGVDEFAYTSPVGSFRANKLGIYDLGGNVWEWCEDEFPVDVSRVLRGGSWFDDDRDALLSSERGFSRLVNRGDSHGFRVVVER
jgi:formylglycine-generating enzyme required for sulfatase activity